MSIASPTVRAATMQATAQAGPPVPPGSGAFRQVVGLLRPRRALLLCIVALVVTSASLELVPPLLLRTIVDNHLMVGNADGLIVLALLYLLATATVEATRAFAGYLTGVAAQGTLHDLRVRLFSHFQSLPIRWFDRTPLGEAIAHSTSDIEAIQTLFTSGVASLVIDLARVVTISIALVMLSPPLAGFAALTVPPLLVLTRRLQREVREAERRNRAATGIQGAQLQETLVGAETIQTFARQDVFVQRLRETLHETLAASNRATLCSALYTPNVTMLAAFAAAGMLWVGARGGLASWDISLGTLTAFVLLLQRAFAPIASLGEQWQTVQGALAGVDRVFAVLAVPSDETGARTSHGEASRLPGSEAAGALTDVTFGYSDGQPILHHVTLVIQPGEHVALVGRTGAGKSSALSLLGGLYEPWSGTVTVLGRNPRDLAPAERRQVFGVVPQTALLFNGTAVENVSLFDPEVTPAMIERAIQMAGAASFVTGLPHGDQTLLAGVGGGRGMRLSAGQTALLALARALVWDPPLILLDEATAAIDAASEAALALALREGVTGRQRGLLTVAHRLATAREADRVVVLEDGRIIEEGPPGDLIRQGGRFATLVELEAAGWDWRDAPPMR